MFLCQSTSKLFFFIKQRKHAKGSSEYIPVQHITYICSRFDKRQLNKGDQCGNETHTLYLPLAFSPIPQVRSSETKITSYQIFTDMKFKFF